ncbi:MAG: hypothetical protein V4794_14515 [Pseudomonadota bacterium]
MYGWFTLDDNEHLVLNLPEWDFMSSPVLTDDARKARIAKGVSILAAAFPTPQDLRLKIEASLAVNTALSHVTDEQVDYAIHMGVAFYRLHRADAQARQQAISAQVDAELGPVPKDADQALKDLAERLKAVGFLLPEISRGLYFNTFCTQVRKDIIAKPSPKELMPLRTAATAVYLQWQASKLPDVVWKMAHVALISCMPGQLSGIEQQIRRLLTDKRADVFAELEKCYSTTREQLTRALRDCALREGLEMAVAELHLSASEVASNVFAQAQAMNWLEDQVLEFTSIAAIDAGVDLGEHTESSRAALRQVREDIALRQQEQTQALIHQARHPVAAQSLTVSEALPDREALQSWSVYQLTQWIQGPVTGPKRTRALDRKQVVERSRTQPPVVTRSKPVQPAPQHEDLTEQDVEHIANQAYGATAEYFIGDTNDLVALGKQLHASPKLLGDCAAFIDPLSQLALAPGKFDEPHILKMLTEAEQALNLLRADIKTTQATAALQERFQGKLLEALGRETLTPGRRQGGVINCPLTVEDWRWVSDRFHRRWLSSTRYITLHGRPMRLGEDEALALYVTGSSLSSYAFDVSVHLWRRWPGKTSLPSLEKGSFPPMNSDDWYDTRITFCVLHVPPAG